MHRRRHIYIIIYIGCVIGVAAHLHYEVSLNVERQVDGDVISTGRANGRNVTCEQWDAVTFSKKNCTLKCKCSLPKNTFNIQRERCEDDRRILLNENCNGSILPIHRNLLYDLSQPGWVELNFTNLTNQSHCEISTIVFINKMIDIDIYQIKSGFNIYNINNTLRFSWQPEMFIFPVTKIHKDGYLLKIHLQCGNETSQPINSCFVVKTKGEFAKKSKLIDKNRGLHYTLCSNEQTNKSSSNVMLWYILVGCSCFIILLSASIIVFCVCYKRQHRPPNQRQHIPRISSRSSSSSGFKSRKSSKSNEPATPAIHDMIVNDPSCDGDGGFSNRALSDSGGLEFGIPVDCGTIPRPQSTTSVESKRNSMSPLTDGGRGDAEGKKM